MKKEKRIPTILGIFLVISLASGLFFIQRTRDVRTSAQGTPDPVEVKITNVTDSSFVVSWVSTKEVSGAVKVMIDGLSERIFSDLRGGQASTTHYVIAEGLDADKQHRFLIISGGKSFSQPSGLPFTVTTAKAISGELPSATLASGVVKDASGNAAAGSIVYLSIAGIGPQSSLVTSSGNWAVSLATAFSSDLTQLANYQDGEIQETIAVQGGTLGVANAVVFTNNDDPVPEIIMGKNHDFTRLEPPSPTTTRPPSGGGSLQGIDSGSPGKPFIINNPEDGEVVGLPRPEIFGGGAAGGVVEIILESPKTYQTELVIDDQGDWRWVPPDDLEPGSHDLTVTYTDPITGEKKTTKRTFVLAAQTGEDGPGFSSSPSAATVTAAPSPTEVPSPTSGPTTTVAPTKVPSPTAVASASATPTTPARTSQPSTESGVPTTGFRGLTVSLLLASLIVFLLFVVQLI